MIHLKMGFGTKLFQLRLKNQIFRLVFIGLVGYWLGKRPPEEGGLFFLIGCVPFVAPVQSY